MKTIKLLAGVTICCVLALSAGEPQENLLLPDYPLTEEADKQWERKLVKRESGGLDFGELPPITGIESFIVIGQTALQSYFLLVRMFVDILRPGPLPYEIVIPTIASVASSIFPSSAGPGGSGAGPLIDKRQLGLDFENDIQPVLTEFVIWLVPLLVVAGLGLLVAVLFPLCGCCFCCFRVCCGKCGAKNYKYKTKYELPKCLILGAIFVVTNLLVLIGVVLGLLSNDQISASIKSYPSTIQGSLNNSISYLNGTLNEVEFLADDSLTTVFNTVTGDIQNASAVLGGPLTESLQSELDPFLTNSTALLDNLDAITGDLGTFNSTLVSIEALSLQLNASLTTLGQSLDNLTAACVGNMMCEAAVPQYSTTDVALDIDKTAVEGALVLLRAIDINGTRSLITGASELLNNISSLIDDGLAGFDLPLNVSLVDDVTEVISQVQETVDQELGVNGTVGQVNAIIDLATMYIDLAEMYRYLVFVGLFVSIFLIWLVYSLGMLCAVFGYSRKALPYERSEVSNCGSRLLFMAVTISFLTLGLVLTLTSLVFLLSAGVQKICDDLGPTDYSLVERVIDEPSVWGGYTLAGALSQNLGLTDPLNISVSTLLRRCGEDQSLFSALQADSFLDINSILGSINNLTSEIDLSGPDFSSLLSFTSSDFIPASLREDFQDLASNISSGLNFTTLLQLVGTSQIESLDIAGLSNNLTVLATYYGANGFPEAGNETLSIRDNLIGTTINSTLMDLQTQLEVLETLVENLEARAATIAPLVDQTFTGLDSFLNNTPGVVNTEIEVFVGGLFGYFTGFINFTVDAVMNELGRCGPVAEAYGALHNNFCVQTIDGVNGFWFSLGWVVLFSSILLVTSAMITTYVRKSKTDIHTFVEAGKDEVISNREFYQARDHELQEIPRLNTPTNGW